MTEFEFGSRIRDDACVLALGFFDCVHRGHRHLFAYAKALARKRSLPLAVITFENDPFAVLGKHAKPIYDYETRKGLLKECGVDLVVRARFDAAFMSLSACEFTAKLARSLSPEAIVCGDDYRFGAGALGTPDTLRHEFGEGIVHVVEFLSSNGQKISSGSIRAMIGDGQIEQANELLGKPYFMSGQVLHGRGVGSAHHVPTANIEIDTTLIAPKNGVYGTVAEVDGKEYYAVTNVGAKPTFGVANESVETYIVDFDGDLYGKTIRVAFLKRLRDVQCFSDTQELYQQIEKDLRWYL